MNKQLILAAAIAMALSGTVYAQNTTTDTQNNATTTTTTTVATDGTSSSWLRDVNSPYRFRASDIIGMNVRNMNDETIGEVDDLIITGGDSVAQAVISVGGFLGIGDKLVTVPYSELSVGGEDNDYVVYNATEDQLKSQPEFEYNEGEVMGREIGMARYQPTDTMSETRQETAEAIDNAQETTAEAAQDAKEATETAAMEVKEDSSGIWNQMAGNWKQFKGHVKQQWGDLTDDDLDVVEGKRDVLVGKIQERYGISQQEAEQQVDAWAQTL
jgi:uncharacterized protein YjbJ (UPF0337 family)/sporulation protein YlmC with PRC-barrel domain